MASICIIADTHRKHRELTIPPCDILIHCGDLCSFQEEDLQTLDDIDSWFAEAPAKHVVCIGGNHDFLIQSKEFHFKHAICLEDSGIEIEGLSIYGSPWCPDLSGFAYYATEEELIEKWRKIPSGIDILITRNPLSPPSAPVQRRLQGPPAKSNFLAATPFLPHELRPNSFFTDFPPEANS